MRYPHILNTFYNTLWALRPEDHQFISGLLQRRSAGENVTREDIQLALEGKTYGTPYDTPPGATGIAVIPLHGTILNRAGMMQVSGYTSPQDFASAVRAAASDDAVREIILSVDSPGGTVDGTNTAAEAVREAAKTKKVTAVADGMMASGAYWISSQATRVVVDPTAIVGSIGVIATHADLTRQADEDGVTITYFRSVPHKALGQPYEPLTDAANADLTAMVMGAHREFTAAVTGKRGPLNDAAASGRTFTGIEAVEAGLADEVGTLHSVIEAASKNSHERSLNRARAAANRAAGRTTMNPELLKALGLPEDATEQDALAAVTAMRKAHAEATNAATAARRAALARDLLTAAKLPVNETAGILDRCEAVARDAATDEAATDAVNAILTLTQERVKAQGDVLTAKAELARLRRVEAARKQLAEANLPATTRERDEQFQARCEETARTADGDEVAQEAVTALISERRDILASQGVTRKATPPKGDTSSSSTIGTQFDVDLEVRRARGQLGL